MFSRQNKSLYLASVLVSCAFVCGTVHGQVRLLDAEETHPGQLTVHIQSADRTELKADALELQLGPDTVIPATQLTSVPVESNQTALLICVDRSGSMGSSGVSAVIAALRETLEPAAGSQALPVNVDLVTFATTAQHLTNGFTNDAVKVKAAVSELKVDANRAGKTHLNDVIVAGIGELRANPADYRRLLVISDGDDEGSEVGSAAMMAQVTSAQSITVDTVGFGAQAASTSQSLATLSGATGGEFILASDQAALTKAIAQLVRQFTTGNRYEVKFSFSPSTAGQTTQTASLLYQKTALPLKVAVTTMQLTAKSPQQPDANSKLKDVLDFVLKFKFLLVAGVVFVTGIVAVIVIKQQPLKIEHVGHGSDTGTLTPVIVEPPLRSHRPATRVNYLWPLPTEGQTVAILEGRAGANSGRRWIVNRSNFGIGSAADNDLVLEQDDFVSGHHAAIKAEGHGLLVTDLASRNGTRVNGDLLKNVTRPLLPGDRISLGQTVIEVLSPSPPTPWPGNNQAQQRG